MIGWFLVFFSFLMNSFSFCWTNNLVWKIQNILFSCLFHGTNWNVLWSELIETIALGEFTIHTLVSFFMTIGKLVLYLKTYIEISKSILTIKLSKQIKFTFQLNWLNKSYIYAFIIHKLCFFIAKVCKIPWWLQSLGDSLRPVWRHCEIWRVELELLWVDFHLEAKIWERFPTSDIQKVGPKAWALTKYRLRLGRCMSVNKKWPL